MAREYYNQFIKTLSGSVHVFEQRQCQGFCRVPNHLLFSKDIPPVEDEEGEMPSCSQYIINYVGGYSKIFGVLALSHAIMTLIQLLSLVVYYFKLPSQFDGDIEYEEDRDENNYLKWQKRKNDILLK
jgi:hypothetical protein